MPNHLKYLSSFFFPACVVWFLTTGPHNSSSALLWTIPLWSIILLDWLSPKIKPGKPIALVSSWFYDAILVGLTCIQFLIIYLLLVYASQLQWNNVDQVVTSLVNLMVMRILVGTTSGSSAIIVAHELIHSSRLFMRFLGRLLLYTVCYDHFVIAHIRGHHSTVATPNDIATARLSESFESYWKRVTIAHFKYAWNSELERLGLTKRPLFQYQMFANSALQGLIIEILLIILIILYFGWIAAFIFLYQAFSGVRLLETINYYQHWGLEQGKKIDTLAWVNQSSLTEYALIGLCNHTAHHKNSSTAFYNTPYSEFGPKMPYGYFVTNLWVKLNNKSYTRASEKILKNYLIRKNLPLDSENSFKTWFQRNNRKDLDQGLK